MPMATLMAILVALCCAGGVVGVCIERRIRAHHPGLWQHLGFPERQTFLVPANQEAQVAHAQWRLLRFVVSDGRRRLNDRRLDRLVRLGAALFAAVAAQITYMVTALFA